MASFQDFAADHPAVVTEASAGAGADAARQGTVADGTRPQVVIWTDGSSRGNPGPGGYGVVLLYTDPAGQEHRRELAQGYRCTTNNRMELMAAIVALETLRTPCQVELHSDSQYLINAFKKGWVWGWVKRGWKTAGKQPVKNPDLWKRLLGLSQRHRIDWVWVRGHAGTDLNERCDTLATQAADGKLGPLAEDKGFFR